jgi:hypothetical protein
MDKVIFLCAKSPSVCFIFDNDTSKLQKYDRIIRFSKNNSLYYHDAMYIGNDKMIEVDFSNEQNPVFKTIGEFYNNTNNIAFVFRYDNLIYSDIEKRIEKAVNWIYKLNYIENDENNNNENIFTGNCEHFVSYCLFGQRYSYQVNCLTKNGFLYISKFTKTHRHLFDKNNDKLEQIKNFDNFGTIILKESDKENYNGDNVTIEDMLQEEE